MRPVSTSSSHTLCARSRGRRCSRVCTEGPCVCSHMLLRGLLLALALLPEEEQAPALQVLLELLLLLLPLLWVRVQLALMAALAWAACDTDSRAARGRLWASADTQMSCRPQRWEKAC